ncbi:hypothetical protein N7468_009222 [Penicillium chermesinum]|uniref:CRAL-TRIO domain-containing protein n=1 Tax=Penicillium chermesinum TaxID=63820 RepID=A0A9W9NHQ7_9EURO|nr:uncharacterized protein N7468_009222 [Penicillium chermesinum]KAJ5220018.1 hypothetical protein N7468_009222 [Penicillium chermesinum]
MATTTTVTASPRAAPALSRDGGESRPSPSRPIPSRSSTSAASPIGFLGNLTPQQHIKLKQLWRILLQYWDPNTTVPDVETCSVASTSQTTKSTRQRMLALTRSQNHQPSKRIVIPPQILLTLKSLGASSSDIRACRSFLVKLPCEQVCPAFLAMLRHENPDALMLRFLREEKWNVVKAWIALLHVLNWRTNTIKVDEILMKGEEAAFLKSRMLEECADKKYGEGFMLQLTTGKGYFHGIDRSNRPIIIVRARCHRPSDQPLKALLDFIVFCIENIRLVMTPPTETVDFPPIKFIIDCFQDNYPGLLGHVLLYNAPKIFAGACMHDSSFCWLCAGV